MDILLLSADLGQEKSNNAIRKTLELGLPVVAINCFIRNVRSLCHKKEFNRICGTNITRTELAVYYAHMQVITGLDAHLTSECSKVRRILSAGGAVSTELIKVQTYNAYKIADSIIHEEVAVLKFEEQIDTDRVNARNAAAKIAVEEDAIIDHLKKVMTWKEVVMSDQGHYKYPDRVTHKGLHYSASYKGVAVNLEYKRSDTGENVTPDDFDAFIDLSKKGLLTRKHIPEMDGGEWVSVMQDVATSKGSISKGYNHVNFKFKDTRPNVSKSGLKKSSKTFQTENIYDILYRSTTNVDPAEIEPLPLVDHFHKMKGVPVPVIEKKLHHSMKAARRLALRQIHSPLEFAGVKSYKRSAAEKLKRVDFFNKRYQEEEVEAKKSCANDLEIYQEDSSEELAVKLIMINHKRKVIEIERVKLMALALKSKAKTEPVVMKSLTKALTKFKLPKRKQVKQYSENQGPYDKIKWMDPNCKLHVINSKIKNATSMPKSELNQVEYDSLLFELSASNGLSKSKNEANMLRLIGCYVDMDLMAQFREHKDMHGDEDYPPDFVGTISKDESHWMMRRVHARIAILAMHRKLLNPSLTFNYEAGQIYRTYHLKRVYQYMHRTYKNRYNANFSIPRYIMNRIDRLLGVNSDGLLRERVTVKGADKTTIDAIGIAYKPEYSPDNCDKFVEIRGKGKERKLSLVGLTEQEVIIFNRFFTLE